MHRFRSNPVGGTIQTPAELPQARRETTRGPTISGGAVMKLSTSDGRARMRWRSMTGVITQERPPHASSRYWTHVSGAPLQCPKELFQSERRGSTGGNVALAQPGG